MFVDIIDKKIKNEVSKALSGLKNKKQFSINEILQNNASDFTKQFIRQEVIKEGAYGQYHTNSGYESSTNGLVLNLNTIIDKERLCKIVEKSVKLQFNYTIRPKWTILNYVFGKMESVPVDVVKNKLSLFSYYKYYVDTILNYINDRPEPSTPIITKKRVQILLDDTDTIIHEKLLTNPSSTKVKNFFLQLFRLKYEDIYQPKLDDSIPFGFIRIFLEDKSFYGTLERFFQFYNYIYDELSDGENLYDSKEIKLKDIIKIITGQIKIEEAEMKYITPEVSDDYLFLIDDAFEEKNENRETKPESNEKKDETLIEVGKEQAIELFSKEEIERIQKKVFKNNKPLLLKFFEQLKNYNFWDEVSEHLKTTFENNDVNIYDEDVVKFVDKLNDYYTSKN